MLNNSILGLVAALLLAVPTQANERFTYDANGNVQSRSLQGGTTQYGYDDLDRLTSEAGPAKSQSLTYDANDNRLSDGTGSKTYTTDYPVAGAPLCSKRLHSTKCPRCNSDCTFKVEFVGECPKGSGEGC